MKILRSIGEKVNFMRKLISIHLNFLNGLMVKRSSRLPLPTYFNGVPKTLLFPFQHFHRTDLRAATAIGRTCLHVDFSIQKCRSGAMSALI